MVHQLTKFHVQRVDMVINPPWNLPFLGAKGLTSPEQTATVEMVFSQPWTCTFLVAKGLTTPELMANCDGEASYHEDASITVLAQYNNRMKHLLEFIRYSDVWKVIQNGNSKKRISTGKDGVIRILPPVTAAEIQAVEKEKKAKNILLMAIPKEHMRRFHGMDDAKEI
ncbi:hypothetical protein Tco_0414259 [Tanacetum coccineum]